ncbi:DUF688 family protein [Medicago truncatula]|uniref:DUF688 family protein n=1 Tax=Medicago truncatula TaxID=3880 RepID=G7LJF0_MEDTR|nr:DUF688 family protein [Medicago truncatula]KEH30223.1 DUF688 family protein [Medicago truncatula]
MMNEGKLNINAPLMSVRRSICTPTSSTKAKIKILDNSLPYNKSDMTQDQVTEPVFVSFNWEHIPGGPKFDNKFRSLSKSNSLSNIMNKVDHNKGQKDEKLQNLEEDDDDDNDDDAFSDALETLSSTESLCVSGLDNLDANKCRISSTDDKQAQEFMMNRFLPAAKAMTLQTHQHAPRKQSVLLQQPSTKLVSEEKNSFVNNRNITDIVPYTDQYREEEEEESDHDETDYYANISAKGCGLFPTSCIKNSLCLLNPMPETKMENQIPVWSSNDVEKPNKSSYFSTNRPGPTIKKAWDAIHKSKSSSGASSPDIYEARKKWTSESKRYNAYSGELNQISRISSFRRSGAATAGVSSFRSRPQSQAENNQIRKLKFQSQGHESFQEAQSQGSKRSSNSRNLSMEIGQESMSLQLVQSSFDKGTKFNKQIVVVGDGLGKSDPKSVMHLLSPPLPKSPSESWLCRALPLVSLKSLSVYSSRGTQSQAVKRIGYSRASSYSKWETIVKTSNLHHDHEFFSKTCGTLSSKY